MSTNPSQTQTHGSEPVLPYADPETGRTSGHSGSDTSADRAHREDADGTTAGRQRWVLNRMHRQVSHGMTVRELRDATGWHHGQASAALSNLHKEGRLARLEQTRDRCKVYVLPQFVLARRTEEHTANKRRSETDLLATARMLRAALAGVQTDYCVRHVDYHSECRHCAAAKALRDTRSL